MMSARLEVAETAPSPHVRARKRERRFYLGMTVAIILTVFAGFAPTYYLKSYFDGPPLRSLVQLHGAMFTLWLLLFLVQTTLVAANRVRLHRRLGMAGGVVAVLMVGLGMATAISGAALGHSPPGSPPPLVFLVIPFTDMLVFSGLVGAGLSFRRRPDVHKRLMLLATIAMLPAAIGRLPLEVLHSPTGYFGVADFFLVPCVLYDLVARGRPHRATVLGGLVIVASQPLRVVIGNTQTWSEFASWLTTWAM
jgi:hypothetical protein